VSLRVRLLLGLIVLAAIGLATADVVNYTSLRTFLIQRADQSLDEAVYSLTTSIQGAPAGAISGGSIESYGAGIASFAAGVIPGDCVQTRKLTNSVLGSQCLPQFEQTPIPPGPVYPGVVDLPAPSGGQQVTYLTVPSAKGGGHYRVRASVEHSTFGPYMLLIAAPLSGVDGTLHRLIAIEVLVSGVVLALLIVLGLWVVRIGLRPLKEIGSTADAITHGDLSRRVARADEKTEIGRLGGVLNQMLGEIESAFQTRDATERKLRRFVADASHELRTPLAAVRAYSELFTRGAAERPADLERSMLGIKRESERMSALVDELILLAHLDEGRPLDRDRVDLAEVVADSLETARALEPERPFAVETEPAVVVGDRPRLGQLVDNLFSNVRAHTPPGTPVHVVLGRSGGRAVLRVEDSGAGMSDEEMAHVFERFYRADVSRARSSGGAGLGLAIVAALAEAHGGLASVESGPGKGATFTISIPLADTTAEGGGGVPETGSQAPGRPAGTGVPVTSRSAVNAQGFPSNDR
jgi:two-component system OmpR family sensor kinase